MLEHLEGIVESAAIAEERHTDIFEFVSFTLASLPSLAGFTQRNQLTRADIRRIVGPLTALDCGQQFRNDLPAHKTDQLLAAVATIAELYLDWAVGAYGVKPTAATLEYIRTTTQWASRGALLVRLGDENAPESLISALTSGHNHNDRKVVA
jgi:hypothetical protein